MWDLHTLLTDEDGETLATALDAFRTPDGTELATAGHGGVFSDAAVSRLLCDANLRRVLTRGDSEVLDLGRSKRQWSVAQRQALNVPDGACRAPACDRPPAWTDAHHIRWWSKDGSTSVDNGILLCRRHHRMLHEGGWTVALDVASGAARPDPDRA